MVCSLRGKSYSPIRLPVSRTDLRSLRIQLQPPVPDSENWLLTIDAIDGAPSS